MYKIVFIILLTFASAFCYAHAKEVKTKVVKSEKEDNTTKEIDSKVNVKLNSAVFLGILNPAVEFRVFNKGSVQLEAWGVLAPKNFLGTGYPCSLAITYGEFRFYPKQVFKGFFCGAHTGWGVYRLNKNILPIFGYLKDPASIQVGQTFILGVTVGYCFIFDKHWGLEVSVGAGRQFSTYEAYTPQEDGSIVHRELNGSAEYLPTKAGIMVTYRF